MKLSVCLLDPTGYKFAHFLYDYCKYLCYTIEAAGYDCCLVRNRLYSDRLNLILGAHYLTEPALADEIRRTGEYAIVQSEVLRDGGIAGWPDNQSFMYIYVPLMRDAVAVIDGFEPNLVHLRALGIEPERDLHSHGFGYLRALEEIIHKKNKDIDFLYYGSITPHRRKLLDELVRRGGKVVTMFDDAAIFRNDLIARTRVNLAPNQAPGINHITSKVLYLLNNRSIVAVERCWNQDWIEQCFLTADTGQWVELCMQTIVRKDLDQLSVAFFERYKKLDMVYMINPLIEKLRERQKTLIKSRTQNGCGPGAEDQLLSTENKLVLQSRTAEEDIIVQKIMEKADGLFQREQFEEAVKIYIAGIKKCPRHRELYHAAAERLIDAKQFQHAFDMLDQMPAGFEDARSLALKGYCKEGLGIDAEAGQYADQALSAEEENSLGWNLKGVLAYKTGDRGKAWECFSRAAQNSGGYGEPYTNMGVMKWSAGEREAGFQLLERGFELSSLCQDISALYHSAASELKLFSRAEGFFEDALQKFPDSRKLHYLFIDLLLKQEKYSDAMDLIEKAIAEFGADDETLGAALFVREKQGPLMIAEDKRNSVSLCMIVRDEQRHIAKCLNSVKDIFDEIIIVDTGSVDRTADIARVFGAQVFSDEWKDDFSEARNMSLSKASGDWIFVLDADELISSVDIERMKSFIKEKVNTGSAYAFVTRNYVNQANIVEWTQNDGFYPEEAGNGWIPSRKVRLFSNNEKIRFRNPVHEFVEQSLQEASIKILDCDIPVHHYGLLESDKAAGKGKIYYDLGVQKVRETDNDVRSLHELAVQATALNKYDEAITLWEKVLEKNPVSLEAYLTLSDINIKKGCYVEALVHADRAIGIDPRCKEAFLNKAISQFCCGDISGSIETLEQVLGILPDYPLAIGLRAVASVVSGDKTIWNKSVERLQGMGFECSSYFTNTAQQLISMARETEALALLDAVVESAIASDNTYSLLKQLKKGGDILLSIIILPLMPKNYLIDCLRTIHAHTELKYELLILGSPETSHVLKKAAKHLGKLPPVSVIYDEAAGPVQQLNRAVAAARGDFVILLQDDVYVTKNWIGGMREYFKEIKKNVGVAGPVISGIRGKQGISLKGFGSADELNEFAESFYDRNRYRMIRDRKLSDSCLMFRRKMFEQAGRFDENLEGSKVIEDFCLRVEIAGYICVIAGNVYLWKAEVDQDSFFHAVTGKSGAKKFDQKWSGSDYKTEQGRKLLSLLVREKADELYQRERLDEAVKLFIAGIKQIPDALELYFGLAEMLIESKEFAHALEVLEQVPDAGSHIHELVLKGYCVEGLSHLEKAEEYLSSALAKQADYAPAVNLQGVLAYRAGEKAKAADLFKTAIKLDPGYGEPYTNLGLLRWSEEAYEQGLDLLKRGFILSPANSDAATHYHSALASLNVHERGELHFREARSLYPNNRSIRYLLIDLLLKQAKYEEAMDLIEDVLAESVTPDEGMLTAALSVREKIGQKDGGNKKQGTLSVCMIVKNEEKYLARCLNSIKELASEIVIVDTGSTDRTIDIARVYGAKIYAFQWNEDFSAARNISLDNAVCDWILVMDADEVISEKDIPELRRIIQDKSKKRYAYSIVTRNYTSNIAIDWHANTGEYPEEAGGGWFSSEKVRLFPNDPRIRFQNPVHELVEYSLKQAGISFKECRVPVHHFGHLNANAKSSKGESYLKLGIEKLRKQSSPKALYELAVQATILDKYDQAIELWSEYIRIMPNDTKPYMNLTKIYGELGRLSEALDASTTALRLSPDMQETVFNYAVTNFYLGNLDEAERILTQYNRRDTEYPMTMALASLIALIKGSPDGADPLIENVRRQGFRYHEYLYWQAKKLIAVNQPALARALLQGAIAANIVSLEILGLITEVLEQSLPDESPEYRLGSGGA